jgi:hypothetical protein
MVKRKIKLNNDVDSNFEATSKKQKVIDLDNNNEFEINFLRFLNAIFINNNLAVNYKENIDFFIKNHLRRLIVRGDGLCFISCLLPYHEYYLNKILTIDIVKYKLYLFSNASDYYF